MSLALGCTVAVGAGVGAAMLGGAALTAGCYDPIDVTVFDAVTGLRACDARVVARSSDGAETKFNSCFHAELPVGSWTVSADRLGYQPVTAALVVSKGRSCEPAVQSIELSLRPLGVGPATPIPIRPPLPGEAPLAPGALPPPPSIGGEQPAAAPLPAPSPGSSSTAPSPVPSGTPSSPPPATSPAPAPPVPSQAPASPPAGSVAPPAPPTPPSGSF